MTIGPDCIARQRSPLQCLGFLVVFLRPLRSRWLWSAPNLRLAYARELVSARMSLTIEPGRAAAAVVSVELASTLDGSCSLPICESAGASRREEGRRGVSRSGQPRD
jgi:hypothetical protein